MIIRWCGVIEPNRLSAHERIASTPSAVVTCSSVIDSSGSASRSGISTRSRNTASRSKMSTSGSVTSPCTHSGTPCAAMASSTGMTRATSATPEAELVVAPAG